MRAEAMGEIASPEVLGKQIADSLLQQGAGEILAALNG
jgi:hypothetical protein